jgi:hypothetical protein
MIKLSLAAGILLEFRNFLEFKNFLELILGKKSQAFVFPARKSFISDIPVFPVGDEDSSILTMYFSVSCMLHIILIPSHFP